MEYIGIQQVMFCGWHLSNVDNSRYGASELWTVVFGWWNINVVNMSIVGHVVDL